MKRETYGSGRGASTFGHSRKNPLLGLSIQPFDPPPQFAIPVLPMSEAPIMTMTVPVTKGGNMRCRIRTGTSDKSISRKEQMREVPRTLPYASGQGSRITVPSVVVVLVHVPSAYIASKIY